MATSNKKTSRKGTSVKRTAASNGGVVRLTRDDSMAQVMDKIVQSTKDTATIRKVLSREAKKRGVKAPTIGILRSHVRYRQARGQLAGVRLPESQA